MDYEDFTEEDLKYINEPFSKADLRHIEKVNKSKSSFFNTKNYDSNKRET